MADGKVGAPIGNVNAVKHGKYSDRDFLTCAVCVAKKKCEHFDENNQLHVCIFEKTLEKPDLSSIEKLLDFLRELLSVDWLRFQRAVAFERLSGGMLDADALKLEFHMRGVAFTIAKLSELRRDAPEIIVEIQETEPKPQLSGEALIASVIERFREAIPSYEESSEVDE